MASYFEDFVVIPLKIMIIMALYNGVEYLEVKNLMSSML